MGANCKASTSVLALALALCVGNGLAQSRVGEVLEKGGKKLNGDEARAMLSGSTHSGKSLAGFDFVTTYKADGTLAGRLQTPGGNFPMSGSWRAEADGKICGDVYVDSPPTGSTTRGCGFYFQLGERIFFGLSDSNPGANVLERTVKR